MRVAFIVILIILGILLALPYWFGIRTEKDYGNLLTNVSQAENITIVDKSYKRGWLSSRAGSTFEVRVSEDQTIRIHNEDTIYHGPIPLEPLSKAQVSPLPVLAVIDSKAAFIQAPGSEYESLLRALPPISYMTVLSLNGGGKTEINMPGVESNLSEDGSEYLTWSGLKADIDFGPGFEDMETNINSPGLVIKSEDLELSVSGLSGESDISYEGDDFYLPLGSATFNLSALSIKTKDEETLEFDELTVDNIRFEGSTEDIEGTLTSVHSLGFDQVSVGDLTYGPGGYKFALRNIDKEAWKQIQNIIQEASDRPQDVNEELSNTEMLKIVSVLPELMRKSPELEISELLIKTGSGDLNGSLFIAIDGSSLEDPEVEFNLFFLLAAITANAELSVTKSLLDEAYQGYNIEEIEDEIKSGELGKLNEDEIKKLAVERTKFDIGELTSQNILVLEDDRYVLNAEYQLGQIILNGTPIGLDSLLGQ